ncbi:class I SAM-dependent methyltransferase [Flavobacterium sp.]|jgi:16S rRNA G966 N2-methylase RsmD|uniref:THUMP-like domain-containing protein n=1 Tax=Flavobacterium sp. TaxID=239 RepID=UPI0037C05624
MQLSLLSAEIQEFINSSLQANISKLALSKNPFLEVDWKEIINQIVSKNKSQHKLPTWFNTDNIYYPASISIEQTSSETTAKYKSELISGTSLIDLTGGFGVDDYYFSKKFKHVIHCEKNVALSEMVQHNYGVLNVNNITCLAQNSTDVLMQSDTTFDWIYIDPSRRSDVKGKVFLLKDCLPNVPENLSLYFSKSQSILIKTAPILDITAGCMELENIKSIHIVAIENEVKEILWLLEKGYDNEIELFAVNIQKEKTDSNAFILGEHTPARFSLPQEFLYEPNAPLLKSGGVDYLCDALQITKLHPHSHLFTYSELIDFPGRRFSINEVIPFKKENLKKQLEGKKMNITTRNFPLTVEEIRKKYKIADGGTVYAFFTTNINNEKIVLICTKI